MLKKLRPFLSLALMVIALAAGIFYISKHPALLRQLEHTSPATTLTVFALYVVMFGVLMLIFDATVRVCNKRISTQENASLNSHSLFINFFIPGQGGPAYRGYRLMKTHKLKVKKYIAATLIYYFFYALVSVFLMFVGRLAWWELVGAILGVTVISGLIITRYTSKPELQKDSLDLRGSALTYLFGVTVLQSLVQAVIYFIELHSVNQHIDVSQTITYTGTANLALFASLTPGAIGIRESFLILSQHLHHIDSSNIIAANVIDRGVYIAFLLILLLLSIAMQLKGRGRIRLQDILKRTS